MKNFGYENQCFLENYDESSLRAEGLAEILDEEGLEIQPLNGFHKLIISINIFFLIIRTSKKFFFNHIFQSYDQISEYFMAENNENNPVSLLFEGFNNNILWLTSESPYEIDKKIILEIMRKLHNKARNETLSFRAFSIFHDRNEKSELIFDYFSRKGRFYIIYYISDYLKIFVLLKEISKNSKN